MDLRHRQYTERPLVKTKIIATVGPATDDPQQLRELVLAGVDIFRLNFAHAADDWLDEIVRSIREVSAQLQRPIAILGDLTGPKIRLGELSVEELRCEDGEIVRFVQTPDPDDPRALTSNYDRLLKDLQPQDRILLADGTVALRVIEKSADETSADAGEVKCVVEQPGVLRSRQGINLPGVSLSTPALTEKDYRDLSWAVHNRLDFIGLSFVRAADDITLLRKTIDEELSSPASGRRQPTDTTQTTESGAETDNAETASPPRDKRPQIVAKIEKLEAVNDLDGILNVTDAVMVARGDLGVEVDISRVPPLQKEIIHQCNRHRIPVITATQMLDSMQRHELPTRAESSDVANAVLDGSDALMLSGETAIGRHPAKAVAMMSRIAHEAERLVSANRLSDSDSRPETRAKLVTEAVTLGASMAAEHLQADLIVVATHSGRTAMAVSKQRSPVPILALTDRPETSRRMCLYWGVTPVETDAVHASPQELMQFVVEWGRRQEVFSAGSRFVVVGSTEWASEGHDLMMVHVVP